METMVSWNAGGGSLNEEVEWRQWYSGTRGKGSLNQEIEWRQWYSGDNCMVERRGGKFK